MRLRNKPRPPREAATVGDTDGGAGAGTAGSGRGRRGPGGRAVGAAWGLAPAAAVAVVSGAVSPRRLRPRAGHVQELRLLPLTGDNLRQE